MERDFLGLATNSAPHHNNETHNDSVEQTGSGLQWSFSDKVPTSPQVVSFKSYLEEKPKRAILDPVTSPRFVAASTTGNYGQRNMNCPVPNNQHQTSSCMNCPVLQLHTLPTEQHMSGSTLNPQSFGCALGVSPTSRIPAASCLPTYTDMRSSKPPSGSAQLTIFYAGSVSVYDGISPEKAQAIMLLAGNGSLSTPPTPVPSTRVQAPFTNPPPYDVVCIGNPSRTMSAGSGLVSPVSIISHVASQCGRVSNQRAMTSFQQQTEPPKVVNSQRLSAGSVIPGAVPQTRKASLARFLEKRKERVTNTHPYLVEKKFSERDHNTSSVSGNLDYTFRSSS